MDSDKPEQFPPDLPRGSRLLGQYREIEQPDGSVLEMHVMRIVRPGEKIPLVVRTKAVPWEPSTERDQD